MESSGAGLWRGARRHRLVCTKYMHSGWVRLSTICQVGEPCRVMMASWPHRAALSPERLPLPASLPVNPSDVAVFLRNHGISAVSSAAFCTDNNPPQAMRMCLGGPVGLRELEQRLNLLRDVLQENVNFTMI